MKKNGRLVAIALGSVLCASCVGGAFFVAGNAPAAEAEAVGDSHYSWMAAKNYTSFFNSVSNEIEVDGVSWKWTYNGNNAPASVTFQSTQGAIQLGSKNSPFQGGVLTGTIISGEIGDYISTLRVCTASYEASATVSVKIGDTEVISDEATGKWTTLGWAEASLDDPITGDIVIEFSPSSRAFYFGGIEFDSVDASAAVDFQRIEIAGTPVKSDYYVGDAFSTEGLSVLAYQTSEGGEGIDVTDQVEWLVDPETFDSVGNGVEVTVIAGLQELTADATYTVNVKEPATVTSLEVEGLESKRYNVGERFDVDGLKIFANMSDGNRIDVTGDVEFASHEFTLDECKSGTATITLSYKGHDETIEVQTGFMTIAEAKGLSTEVTIVGVITGKMRDPNSKYKNSDFYLNDGTAGLRAFRVDDSLSSELKFGDRVIMTGTPQLYNGFYELTDVSYVEVIEEGVEPEPLKIDEFSADALKGKDGMYVSLSGLSYKDGSLWAANKRDTMTFSFAGGDVDAYCVLDSDAKALQGELDGFFDKIEGLKFDYTGNMTFFNSNPQISPISIDEFSCPDYDAVMAFVNAYMHPEVSHDDTDEGNACLEWYPKAKQALESLTESQKDYFLTSKETADYAARYNAWAAAYGDGATSSLGRIMSSNDTAAIIALVALSSATVAAAGFMIASRHRKAK